MDMRGKSARLVRGEDIAKEVSDEDEDAAFTLPLVHNLAILIEAAETEIFRVQKTVESDADAKVALRLFSSHRMSQFDRFRNSIFYKIVNLWFQLVIVNNKSTIL